jgi:signal transduction histidine kinase
VAAVSHEFRSPLTTMRQMAEMLETDRVPEEARRKQYYGVLAGETARLQRLVERLLDFGRMEAGHDEMRREPLDVAALVQEVVDEMQATAVERGGRIEMEQAAPLVRVDGDAQSLRLAVRNLVENAIKYSPETPAVVVRLAVDAGRASIAVSDAGLGIDRDEQAAIFGKFVRGRAAAAGRVRGTGVGLAAVKHVVDAHGGEITLESESGRGSTFTVWLPLAGTAVDTAAPVAEGSEA